LYIKEKNLITLNVKEIKLILKDFRKIKIYCDVKEFKRLKRKSKKSK
jgi:hypothetical protein